MKWSVNQGYATIKQMGYNFTYDPMSRILNATSRKFETSWAAGGYDENVTSYDLNGNIKALTRKTVGGANIDVLVYNYGAAAVAGNRLLYVQDNTAVAIDKSKGFVDGQTGTAIDYSYDFNGNMTRDLNKGIGTALTDTVNRITYNHLNLPQTVTKGGNTMRYVYDATGRKLSQEVTQGTTRKRTDYVGEFIYENDILQFIGHEEGRAVTASERLVLTDAGADAATMTAVTATLTAITDTGNGEKYVQIETAGATGSGAFPIGGPITVVPGERYRIRVKGYSTGTNPVFIAVKSNGVDLNWPGAQLPSGKLNESWTEQVVTIPAGGASVPLTVGVKWTTAANGDRFFLNELEVEQILSVTPEYQYHLKDHLGNVRVTFTSKNETESVTATLENATMNAEKSNFLRYNHAKRVNATIFDRTNGASPGYSQRLSGRDNEKYGLARSLSVMPGDVIDMEVWVKYVDPVVGNRTAALNTLLTQIANNAAGVVVDGITYATSTSAFPYGGLVVGSPAPGAPKAYLNWLIFDRNFNFKDGGFQPMQGTAKEAGTDVPHERIWKSITIKEPGYVYIYYSNDELNSAPVEVFFDDFNVTQTKLPIVQVDDYYPFGLTFNSYTRENSVPNKVKFQGQERVDDLNLGWDSFKWRNHQPEIGRFFNTDPLASDYVYNSPYAFAENKLGRGVELEGLELAPMPYFFFARPAPTVRPVIETMVKNTVETGSKVSEATPKTPEGRFSPEALENFARGNRVEGEQLAKSGLEKNTRPIEAVDPTTGQKGTTTPDALPNEGKSTVEVKNVKQQSLTRQLRLQREYSEGNGFKPELIINKGARISQPLKDAGFDIKYYSPIPSDATRVAPKPDPAKVKPILEWM